MRQPLVFLTALICTFTVGTADARDLTGSWEYRGPAESGMWLMTQQAGNEVRFQLEVARGGPSYNTGWIEGTFSLKGTSGIFRTNEHGPCQITFKFSRSFVQIKPALDQEQKCGFGHNVYAEGTLRRRSSGKPQFSNGDPRFQ
jgi:hypothetical protein